MNVLNKAIVSTLPLVPRRIVRKFANRYIAGDELKHAVDLSKKLNGKGITVTLDVLGEDVFNREDAGRARSQCIEVLEAIEKNRLEANLSLKLTSLGLKIDFEFCLSNLLEILSAANSMNQFVRIDMEDSSCTEDTIGIFERSRQKFPEVGVVIQAYLKRSIDDVTALVNSRTNFRVCKGIYVEPPEIAYKEKEEINRSFMRLVRHIMSNGCYVGIATHDDKLVEESYRLIDELGKKKNEYEFQMLLGVRENLRDKILRDGHRLRVYIPFGSHWYQYSIRRFKENPQIAGYVFKSLFMKKHR